MPAAPPGRAWLEGLVGCRDLGTVTVAAAVCPLAGGVLPVPTAQGPAPPGASIRRHRGDGGPQKSRLAVRALKPAPAWGWRCRCVVGDASQEREGTRAKECVGGPRPWKHTQHGDGLGLIPHGASTPPAVPHGPPRLASQAPAAARGWGAARQASPLPSHLVPGLETLPSVGACLGTPARDPRPL